MKTILVRLAQIAAAGAWFLFVFLVSFWLTFPSEALADRIRFGVQESGRYLLDVGSVSPSGFGVRADDFALYSVAKARRKDDPPKSTLMFEAETVRLRSGPWSMMNLFVLGGSGRVKGSVSRAGGDLGFSTLVQREEGDKFTIQAIEIAGEGLPLSAFPAPDAKLEGTGGWDLDIALDSAEGLSKADGHIGLSSSGAVIEKIDAAALQGFDLGAITLSQIDIAFDVVDGKAKIARGVIQSSLAQIDVEGDVSLTDDIVGSRLRLKLVITMAEGPLANLAGQFAKDAKWDDEKLHYAASGTLGKPRFRAERERKVRAGAAGRPKLGGPDVGIGPMDGAGPIDRVPVRDAEGELDPEEEARREERRKLREDAISERRDRLRDREDGEGGGPVRPSRIGGPPIEEDMMPPDEELPPGAIPEDELPPLDEEPPPIEEDYPQ